MASIKEIRYIVSFHLSNGEKYYIGKNLKLFPLDSNVSYDDMIRNAKQYSLHGAKCVTTNLWKKYGYSFEIHHGYKIIFSRYICLKVLKERFSKII